MSIVVAPRRQVPAQIIELVNVLLSGNMVSTDTVKVGISR